MKLRMGFIANSSSSHYLVALYTPSNFRMDLARLLDYHFRLNCPEPSISSLGEQFQMGLEHNINEDRALFQNLLSNEGLDERIPDLDLVLSKTVGINFSVDVEIPWDVIRLFVQERNAVLIEIEDTILHGFD
jgi:hypothetical protein